MSRCPGNARPQCNGNENEVTQAVLRHAGETQQQLDAEIESLIASPEREFTLFGVVHLVDEDGILQQLRRRGYTSNNSRSSGIRTMKTMKK